MDTFIDFVVGITTAIIIGAALVFIDSTFCLFPNADTHNTVIALIHGAILIIGGVAVSAAVVAAGVVAVSLGRSLRS